MPRLISAFVFLSGMAGLTYQLIWTRLFSTIYGNSTYAISAVVATFMLGLALGALLAGRLAARRPRPLLLYGLVELGLGASALAVPTLIDLFEPMMAWIYGLDPSGVWKLTTLRSIVAVSVMLVPTTLMGATLPIVADWFVPRARDIGRGIGFLYAVNTLGAVIGCVATGVWLVRWLGVTNASYAASAVNLAIGAGAIFAGRGPDRRFRPPEPRPLPVAARSNAIILAALFVSGFTALSLEVIWSRVLGFVFAMGMSVYAFTIVLAVLLAGVGLGGLLYAWRAAGIHDPIRSFGLVLMLGGASVLGAVFLFATSNSPRFLDLSSEAWVNDVARAALLMGVPSLLMGIGFPLGCRIMAEDASTIGQPLGLGYAANTIGCVLGPLVTGFLLIPGVGTEATLKLMVTAQILTGLALWTGAGRAAAIDRLSLSRAAAIAAATIALNAVETRFLIELFNTGDDEVVYFREGPSDSLLAIQEQDGVQLIIGGSVGAGSTLRYQRTDELLAYIPLLLHSSPRDVAVVGFGTGRTAGLYAQHPAVERVDVVEIAQGALASGHDVFAGFNGQVLVNPKVRTFLDDGFNFMKYQRAVYDVVSLDPFSPRDPGSARLYTREFLTAVKERLTDGGVVVMWAYPARVRRTNFGVALKTFQSVFAHATVWTSPVDEMFLFVGTPQPVTFDRAAIARRLAGRPPQDRYPYHVNDAAAFERRLLLDEQDVRRIVAREEEPVFTIDRPNLEFIYLTDRSRFVDAAWWRGERATLAQ